MLTITSSAAFAALVACASVAAGLIGALTGLGGGVILVPVLTLGFGVNLRYAVGASLISVIATSSGAASSYVKDGYANMRIGILMEVATTVGAIGGATLASRLPTGTIAIIFGIVLLYATFQSARPAAQPLPNATPDKLAKRLRLEGVEPTPAGPVPYAARHVPGGVSVMAVAGAVSGLLGIGSGALKVLAMDRIMRLPFKVSTTTSNFMIGVTAAASAGIYLRHGYVDPVLACPVMLGVLLGALVGARVLVSARVNLLRLIFVAVLGLTAIEMIVEGVRGAL